MDGEGIDDVIDAFTAAAAERSRDVGFEVAEVHAAHGYLLHQFLSPVTNDRDDAYGGSFENRTRLLLREVVEAVREVWPDDQPVFVRISATDWPRPRLVGRGRLRAAGPLLAEAGADLIDVSGAGSTRISSFRGQGRAIRCRTPRRFGGDRRARRRSWRDHGANPRRRPRPKRAGRPRRAWPRDAPTPVLAA